MTSTAIDIVDGRTLSPACWFVGRPRRVPVRAVVWHWTAGSGRAERVARTLANRGLSIHYVIDHDGRVVRMADHDRVTSHAGSANAWSVGVEVVSPGVVVDAHEARERALGRAVRIARAHGRAVRAWSWTPPQRASIAALAARLSRELNLPLRAPDEARLLSAADLSAWRGHLEHAHVSATKIDCAGLAAEVVREAATQVV